MKETCGTCKFWEPEPDGDFGTCRSMISYTPGYPGAETRTVEALAMWGSDNEYEFAPPVDFGCNRWKETP